MKHVSRVLLNSPNAGSFSLMKMLCAGVFPHELGVKQRVFPHEFGGKQELFPHEFRVKQRLSLASNSKLFRTNLTSNNKFHANLGFNRVDCESLRHFPVQARKKLWTQLLLRKAFCGKGCGNSFFFCGKICGKGCGQTFVFEERFAENVVESSFLVRKRFQKRLRMFVCQDLRRRLWKNFCSCGKICGKNIF